MKELKLILLIEDEPDIQEIVRSALELVGGYEVISAYGGKEGYELAIQKQPDLILLDMMMPGINGAETFVLLHENAVTTTIPVVFMTAKVQQHEIDSYLALGSVALIPKPFDPMTIS
ncbi:MAG: response regulator, partial [Candidatus Cloacimonadaceae bacterium]|nr:response regulator [Candidatus Cloacimonadaceae bacterium]